MSGPNVSGLDLRPLSLGDVLDRTFLLYRRYFLLFLGITAIPQVIVLAFGLARIPFQSRLPTTPTISDLFGNIPLTLLGLLISLIAYLFSQGATVLAVSDVYLGRPTSISESLKRVWNDIGSLFGVIMLNGLVVGLGYVLLVIPGIYLTCRLLVCVPAALIENRGPRESLERSFGLTRENAGRAFVILVLSAILSYAASALFVLPFTLPLTRNPNPSGLYSALTVISASISGILVGPVLRIATAIFYYDLRVRKEAFDLEFMMNPDAPRAPRVSGPPSILS